MTAMNTLVVRTGGAGCENVLQIVEDRAPNGFAKLQWRRQRSASRDWPGSIEALNNRPDIWRVEALSIRMRPSASPCPIASGQTSAAPLANKDCRPLEDNTAVGGRPRPNPAARARRRAGAMIWRGLRKCNDGLGRHRAGAPHRQATHRSSNGRIAMDRRKFIAGGAAASLPRTHARTQATPDKIRVVMMSDSFNPARGRARVMEHMPEARQDVRNRQSRDAYDRHRRLRNRPGRRGLVGARRRQASPSSAARRGRPERHSPCVAKQE